MRQTFSQIILASQDYCIDDTTSTQTGLSSSVGFIKREVNNTVKDIFSLMKKYSLQPLPKTATTVINQTWYHMPSGLSKIESITMPMGNLVVPLRVIESQAEWDQLHIIPITSNFPEAYFPRRDDFGIYPTPKSAVTLTIVGNYSPQNMTILDVTSPGTVATANNSQTVTGTSTTFASSMVGEFFMLTDTNGIGNGATYRISAYTSATAITLENTFQESSVSGASYLIGQSPDIPEELIEFIPYRVSAIYYANRRRDLEQSQRFMNFYYTGDFANPRRTGNIRGGILAVLQDLRERGRGNSQMAEIGGAKRINRFMADPWSASVTQAAR